MRSTVPSTPTSLRPRKASLQQGQAIVLIALLILVLFGMLGLAIDSGRGYVDRRDQQTAVDASALSAGDWYENTSDLTTSINKSVTLYQQNLRIYSGIQTSSQLTAYVGATGALRQDTFTYTFAGSYTLTIVATDTQFNGYQFVYTTNHNLPLAFMQIFGGGLTIPISATATSIVGNQRQTPALLTLSNESCSMNLKGGAQLTVLGDVYSNGTACVDSDLHEAGNCYGAAGSTCSSALYYCYNDSPGFVPYAPPCLPGDILGGPVVPAPTLPDPGFLAPSVGYYGTAQTYNQYNRGTWTEMYPGRYGNFHLSGGSASCAFLNGGVYNWTNDYTSDANGSLLSNELKAPDEQNYASPGTASVANPQFWDQNGVGCSGHFTVTNSAPGQNVLLGPACTSLLPNVPAGCHTGVNDTQGRNNRWGLEVTSVRFDRFLDTSLPGNGCSASPGCYRESAPSSCHLTPSTVSGTKSSPSSVGISVNITQNAPGAQYYNIYLNPNGCNGLQSQFGFVGTFNAPGFLNGNPTGTYPSGTAWTLGSLAQTPVAPTAGASLYDISDVNLPNIANCYDQWPRSNGCPPPADEQQPQCFSSCPPPANLLSQENPPMTLQRSPYFQGDTANENYCVPSPTPGNINSPCVGSAVTPGAVQFYFPSGSCFSQNSQGATYVFSGVQYNWIVIYAPASNSCSPTLNGGASTQYIGTIYTPAWNWTINGGDRSPLAGQVICYTAKVSGAGAAGIDFNPNYSPVPPAARLIN
jgi:Flp pilus assembly protein TadG